jgi:hypothetical protein
MFTGNAPENCLLLLQMKPPRSLKISDHKLGSGRKVVPGDVAVCHCRCSRSKGDVVFSSEANGPFTNASHTRMSRKMLCLSMNLRSSISEGNGTLIWRPACRIPLTVLSSEPMALSAPLASTQCEQKTAINRERMPGEALLNEIVQDVVPGLWEDRLHDVTGICVFRYSECGRRTGHWDIA